MAEQYPQGLANNSAVMPPEETKERGCFDFMTKKEKKTEDLVMTDLNAAKESKEEKHTLMGELQRTHSHSSSSSDEDVEEAGERKKKKKKGLKEAIKEKISGDKEGEDTERKETCVPMEKCSEEENAETALPEEKKGFLEKIKEKLPGQHKKGEEDTQTPPACEHSPGSDTKEKKGILDKIKEKLPGHHKNDENEVKN
ncbi:hypothetical protein Pfo_004569 [Paulownia fortunei]|nr:hypothetical protein Pfo_004569 [Paulownia fortunei]